MQNKPGKKGKNKSSPITHKKKFPRLLQEIIEQSDIILEVLDARFINETRNENIEKQILKKGKAIIFVINKADLTELDKLKEKTKEEGIYPYALVSSRERNGTKKLRDLIKREASKINKERIFIGIIGYPNTGKSSVINVLIGKSSARTAPQSGFTKGLQKLKLTDKIVLIDSPGVIPEEEYSSIQREALSKHAKISVRTFDRVKDPEMRLMDLMKDYGKEIQKFYKIEVNQNTEELLEQLGRKKNILKKGNEVDMERTARTVLEDWQKGKIKI